MMDGHLSPGAVNSRPLPENDMTATLKSKIPAIFAATADFLAKTFFILPESPYLCIPQ
jgi:hypothetical protein